MVVRLFISYNVNSYTGKKASLYQHSPLLFLSDVEWLADIVNDDFALLKSGQYLVIEMRF